MRWVWLRVVVQLFVDSSRHPCINLFSFELRIHCKCNVADNTETDTSFRAETAYVNEDRLNNLAEKQLAKYFFQVFES